jgi:hypothetical protein
VASGLTLRPLQLLQWSLHRLLSATTSPTIATAAPTTLFAGRSEWSMRDHGQRRLSSADAACPGTSMASSPPRANHCEWRMRDNSQAPPLTSRRSWSRSSLATLNPTHLELCLLEPGLALVCHGVTHCQIGMSRFGRFFGTEPSLERIFLWWDGSVSLLLNQT